MAIMCKRLTSMRNLSFLNLRKAEYFELVNITDHKCFPRAAGMHCRADAGTLVVKKRR